MMLLVKLLTSFLGSVVLAFQAAQQFNELQKMEIRQKLIYLDQKLSMNITIHFQV